MYQAPTYRHVDEPVRFLGFDLVDWMAAFFVFGPVQVAVNLLRLLPGGMGSVVCVAAAIGVAWVLRALKRGKPRRYLAYLIHRSRASRLLPPPLRVEGTAPAPGPLRSELSLLVAPRHNKVLYQEAECGHGKG